MKIHVLLIKYYCNCNNINMEEQEEEKNRRAGCKERRMRGCRQMLERIELHE